MACSCHKHKLAVAQPKPAAPQVDTVISSVSDEVVDVELIEPKYVVDKEDPAVKEALEIDLPSCYECVKKHIGRAQAFFEEYHTGYSGHIKNLMNSLQVAEDKVKEAFLLWQKTQAQLDMASGELLGNNLNAETMSKEHIQLANDIREARLKLNQDPLYVPLFDAMLIRVQQLEYTL